MMNMANLFNNKLVQALLSLLALTLLLVWMQGGFTAKTPPGTAQAAEAAPGLKGTPVRVEWQDMDEMMHWPGTVTARSTVQVSSKVPARILAINVNAGDAVQAGQILARLDPSELQARTSQARSGLAAMEAQAAKAQAEWQRTQNLFKQEAATRQSLEAAQAADQTAKAQIAQAKAAIATAESLLGETVLSTPLSGIVVKRLLEPGDMALPGVPVLMVQSGQRLRVEAAIPEACARELKPGQDLPIRVADQEFNAKLEEIAPAADPKTRTILVKAGLENSAAVRPGAFAWVGQICGNRHYLLIPKAAVSRSGQLESVQLLQGGTSQLRHIRTGKAYGQNVEVLSGLHNGEVILVGGSL